MYTSQDGTNFGSAFRGRKYDLYHPVSDEATPDAITDDLNQPAYTTPLSAEDETKFQKWIKSIGFSVPPLGQDPKFDNSVDYDYRGFWQAQQNGDPNAKRSENLHFPDTWKTPYHKSFSNESIYSNEDTNPENRHWDGDRLVNDNGDVLVDETPQSKK